MKLLLIRHAESLNQVYERGEDYSRLRLSDPPLSELGRQQAQALAVWGRGFSEVTHLFCSPMLRAIQTVAPLSEALNLDVHLMTQAYEWGGVNAGPAGDFVAVTGGDFATLSAECSRLRWPDDLSGKPWSGGHEPWEQVHFARRAREVAAQLQQVKTAGVIALVTHCDFSGTLLRELLHLPSHFDLRLENVASSLVEKAEQRTTVHWLNRCPPDELL